MNEMAVQDGIKWPNNHQVKLFYNKIKFIYIHNKQEKLNNLYAQQIKQKNIEDFYSTIPEILAISIEYNRF